VKETRIELFIANPPWSRVVFGAKLKVEWTKMLFEFEKNKLK